MMPSDGVMVDVVEPQRACTEDGLSDEGTEEAEEDEEDEEEVRAAAM